MRKMKQTSKRGAQTEYWKSYSDMMAAMLLVFILLMSYSIANALMTFDEKQKELDAKQQELDKQQTILDEQQATLDAQKQKIQAQQKQIDAIIGVKAEIIKSLSQAFSQSNLKVEIDQKTGTIRLDSTILFDVDSDELAPSGQAFLRSFLPMYISVLFNDKFEKYVSEIIVEGHTDNDGPFMYNLNLSQRRAFSVVSYWLNEYNNLVTPEKLPTLRQRLTANGKSFSNLIFDASGLVDKGKSRRVEIRFRLNDEQTIESLKELLNQALSDTSTNITTSQPNTMPEIPPATPAPPTSEPKKFVPKPKKVETKKSWLVD